ncbi:MAG: diaminopimelate epimerase [Candidatus Omnitrophota bacterium]
MKPIEFTKMVASGNDFVVCWLAHLPVGRLKKLAQNICNRKYGIGADGLLILDKSNQAGIRMRLFNADGSEAEMCGNGARCAALWISFNFGVPSSEFNIQTKAGQITAQVKGEQVKIKLTEPKNTRWDMPLRLGPQTVHVHFIDTGVPHTVIFVEGLGRIDVANLGRQIRTHRIFSPRGTNVDFVEALSHDSIKVRTYERGVEDETLACGTGAAASALLYAARYAKQTHRIKVQTQGREALNVYFKRVGKKFKDVWLEGKARRVCKGAYYV